VLIIVVKIAGSLDSFTIVLTREDIILYFELNKNKKDMKAINMQHTMETH
jgi:hypothetical protein